MGIASWIGGAAKGVAEGLATPFSNAWIKTKESQAAIHKVDKETDKEITIASYQADVQLGLAQRLLNEADRAHWSTRWIRPAFAGAAFVWIVVNLWFWFRGQAFPVELDPVVKYLLAGIVGSLFLLRPFEKGKRADIVSTAQVQASKPSILSKITTRRADSQ